MFTFSMAELMPLKRPFHHFLIDTHIAPNNDFLILPKPHLHCSLIRKKRFSCGRKWKHFRLKKFFRLPYYRFNFDRSIFIFCINEAERSIAPLSLVTIISHSHLLTQILKRKNWENFLHSLTRKNFFTKIK